MRQYLLSIDSGGIRGIIPTLALVRLEQLTGRLTREIFSFVAGTSTGAVIAAAVAAGMPAETILTLYMDRASELFPQRFWNPLKRLVFGSMYDTNTLYDIIADSVGSANSWLINDSPIDILITAKGLLDGKPWYFVRDNPANSGRTGQLGLVDCVTASSAAPTYFAPWQLAEGHTRRSRRDRPIGPLVDGGVGVAGNPVYQACVEAFYYTGGNYTPAETTVVSLGTGRALDERKPTWLLSWLEWILGELFRSPGEQQTEIVRRHFPALQFYRMDPDLERPISLDDARSINELYDIGERFAETIDWDGVLKGTDTVYRITDHSTEFPEYTRKP